MKNFTPWLLSSQLLLALPVWANAPQDRAEIRTAVATFVNEQTRSLPGQITINVDEVDRRLTLPACPNLEVFLPPGAQLLGNSIVGVRCPKTSKPQSSQTPASNTASSAPEITVPGKKAWTLFVPVHVTVSLDMLITNKPLQPGQVLRAEDLSSLRGELTQAGILTDPKQVVGKVLKYGVGAGQVLKQDMLRAPYAITQGKTVQLHIEAAGFSIRSEGQPLNNAAEGQSVQIRTPSGRVISGIARLDGIVEVRP